jgi:hypothetical protein
MNQPWTQREIEEIVHDYMKMLVCELNGQSFNKSMHRKALAERLNGRSNGSIEFKHQNISAVLSDLGCQWIIGYKPATNYQQALLEHVTNWVNRHPHFDDACIAAAERPAVAPEVPIFDKAFLEDAPAKATIVAETSAAYRTINPSSVRDYFQREARNAALGLAGEKLVIGYEQFRLNQAGRPELAAKVEHVSQTQGDGLGYDILSYGLDHKPIFIEVKTTAFGKETPFFASNNEVRFSKHESDRFLLYRLFQFRKSPKLFTINGSIESNCRLDPVSYRCSFR